MMTLTDWIQAASALAIVVLTFFLVRTTRRYTEATLRMAQVMASDYEIRLAPVLSIADVATTREEHTCRLTNAGTLPMLLHEVWIEYELPGTGPQQCRPATVGDPLLAPQASRDLFFPIDPFYLLGLEYPRAEIIIRHEGADRKVREKRAPVIWRHAR